MYVLRIAILAATLATSLGCRDRLDSGGSFLHEFQINEESYLLLARVREQNSDGFHTLVVAVSRVNSTTKMADSQLSLEPADKYDQCIVNGKNYTVGPGKALIVFGDRDKLVECPPDKIQLVETISDFIQSPE